MYLYKPDLKFLDSQGIICCVFCMLFFFFFFCLGFLLLTFTIHRATGKGGGHLLNSPLPLPFDSLALGH